MEEPTEQGWLRVVAEAPVGHLATRRGDGRIDLVPFVFAWLEGPGPLGRLVSAVDHKAKRSTELRRFANVADEPEVTVMVDHYNADWSTLWWVRLRGLAHRESQVAERAQAVAALVTKYGQYRRQAPAGHVLVIQLTELVGWSAGGVLPAAGGEAAT